MGIKIVKADITSLKADAIVNAANENLLPGGGVCGAIFRAAGPELVTACEKIGHCATGAACITPGFKSKAKYIVHAVGPIYGQWHGMEASLLELAYLNSIDIAQRRGCKSIVFPLISAGIYGYPINEAWRVAIDACKMWDETISGMDITFAVLSDGMLQAGLKELNK